MVVKRRPTTHAERVGKALRTLSLGSFAGTSGVSSPAPVVGQPQSGSGTSSAPTSVTDTGAGTGSGLIAVEAAQQEAFDATTDPSAITATFRWGIDADGVPYFNDAGVTSGEEAVLAIRPNGTSWSWVLVPLEEW